MKTNANPDYFRHSIANCSIKALLSLTYCCLRLPGYADYSCPDLTSWYLIGFSFASDWLRRWPEIFRPITERSKAKPMKFRITFDNESIEISLSKALLSLTYCCLKPPGYADYSCPDLTSWYCPGVLGNSCPTHSSSAALRLICRSQLSPVHRYCWGSC